MNPDAIEMVISVGRDGDMYLALIGPDIQEGVCGFGPTISDALRELATELEAGNSK